MFLWALGTIMASVIWHFPQYGLAAGAVRDLADLANIQCRVAEGQVGVWGDYTAAGLIISFVAGGAILAGEHRHHLELWHECVGNPALRVVPPRSDRIDYFGLRYRRLCQCRRTSSGLELGKGFIGYYGIPKTEGSVTLVLGMLGAAVGINMTFLYPYSLLAKGWGPSHKRLARWDLGMSMFLPFVLVTSFVILAMTVSGVYDPTNETVRTAMKPLDAAASLQGVMGEGAGRVIFDLGLIGMACGAISAHMVVCGFTVCEMFGLEYTKWRFRIFALVPAIGILGVVTSLPIWFPIAASAVCFTMLPIAYVLFLIMNNKRSYIGDAVGSGLGRFVFNTILVVALAVATIGSAIKLKSGVFDGIRKAFASSPPSAAADEAK